MNWQNLAIFDKNLAKFGHQSLEDYDIKPVHETSYQSPLSFKVAFYILLTALSHHHLQHHSVHHHSQVHHPLFREWLIRRRDNESTKFMVDPRNGHLAIALTYSRGSANNSCNSNGNSTNSTIYAQQTSNEQPWSRSI